MSAPIVFGYNDFNISVTLPAGPPRICTVDGTATVSLADGMELTATNDSVLCLAEPAPGNPGLPRLDMILTAGAPIDKVHPGDQSAHTYRITNNDPTETFTGLLDIELVNSSRLPGASGPMPPGTGIFSISNPGPADNFPIGLTDDLFEGCLPLSRDPTLPIVPMVEEPISLGIRLPGNPGFDGFAQGTLQLSGLGIDNNNEHRAVIWETIPLVPGVGAGIDAILRGQIAPGTGSQIHQLDLNSDARFFFSQELDPSEIFTDGFESGNTTRWSNTNP